MTDTLARLEELLEKATARPWCFAPNHGETDFCIVTPSGKFKGITIADMLGKTHDAQAICAAMNALPKLLRVARAAEVACADHDLKCEDSNGSLELLEKALAELDGD